MLAGHVLHAVGGLRDMRVVAGYLPMRTEIDPRPAMLALLGMRYDVCVPVIEGAGRPLRFRAWTPRARLERGAFGVSHPVEGDWVEPDVILAPLLAFDADGWRLGYGGGYYDRTLMALGLAFAGQQVDAVPRGPEDQRLDAVVTEAGLIRPA
jgi:5-formyltetrahydrofolate cyclo-ligase